MSKSNLKSGTVKNGEKGVSIAARNPRARLCQHYGIYLQFIRTSLQAYDDQVDWDARGRWVTWGVITPAF